MIKPHSSPESSVVFLPREHCEELFITSDSAEAAAQVVTEAGATVVAQDLFGLPLDGAVWPATSVNSVLKGTQVWAIKGVSVESIELEGRIVGSVWNDGFARCCRLGGLLPASADTATPAEQATMTFETMEAALRLAGMDFGNVVRTWFYLDSILKWYDEFNQARDDFFKARKVFDGLVPCSTGMGGANPMGSALTGGLLAIEPLVKEVKPRVVPSPLQCPALEYGSTFSRAVEISMPDHKRLLVSGTASIDEAGATVHVENSKKQVEWTMAVVGAILDSCGMEWGNVTRAVAYLKRQADLEVFSRFISGNNLPAMPTVHVINDVCRDDLLFEIEVDAIKA